MPNLNNLAILINNAMQADQFGSRRYQSSKWYGIAEPVKTTGENETTQPMVLDNDGEGTSVIFDDTNALQVFHRIDNVTYKIADQDYGPPGTTMEETANMRMIFVGNRKRLKTRPENVFAAAAMDFIKEFLPTDITALGMNSCIIEVGTLDSDPYTIWNQEWQGTEFELDTNTFLFSIRYTIINTFNKKCFVLCD